MLLTIEKLIYGGDGLARVPGDGRAQVVFVPFVLEGEQVEAEVSQQKRGFARGTLKQVVSPSAQRVQPFCPYFSACGGCHYQHIEYAHQLQIKREILRETLRRTAKIEWTGEIAVHASPERHYRNRTRLHVQHAAPFAIGYYRIGSRVLLPVRECPISSPLINRAIGALWEAAGQGALPAGVVECELFADHDDARLMLQLYLSRATAPPAEPVANRLWEALSAALPELAGIVFMRARAPRSADDDDTPGEPLAAIGDSELRYRVGAHEYQVSAGSFFQTNRFLAGTLVEAALGDAQGELALDLYAGVGLFSLPLSERFSRVVAVEAAGASSADLLQNKRENISAVQATVARFLNSKQSKFERPPDLVVLDPPRAGMGEEIARLVAKTGAPRLAYVSCDPATLARDLRVLLESGFRIQSIAVADLFPQTFHLETVVHLAR